MGGISYLGFQPLTVQILQFGAASVCGLGNNLKTVDDFSGRRYQLGGKTKNISHWITSLRPQSILPVVKNSSWKHLELQIHCNKNSCFLPSGNYHKFYLAWLRVVAYNASRRVSTSFGVSFECYAQSTSVFWYPLKYFLYWYYCSMFYQICHLFALILHTDQWHCALREYINHSADLSQS